VLEFVCSHLLSIRRSDSALLVAQADASADIFLAKKKRSSLFASLAARLAWLCARSHNTDI
jgi:hypothetical protein